MSKPSHHGPSAARLAAVTWWKSTHSGQLGNCVEAASLDGGDVALRNSHCPSGPALVFNHDEMAAFLAEVKDGEFDDNVPAGVTRKACCAAVLAARYQPGVGARAAHPVHLIPLPIRAPDGVVVALCGARLSPQKLETVEPGQGMPCSMCLLQLAAMTQIQTAELPTEAAMPQRARLAARPDEAAYRELDWPVRLQGDQVVLPLGHCATALVVPMDLAEAITPILTALNHPAPVLLHPNTPACGVVIAGEPYGVPLPWPETVQVVTGMLALPPSQTPHGPVRWYGQAPTHPLTACREIDVFAAMRTAGQAAHRLSESS